MDMNSLLEGNALLNDIKDQKEVVWINPDKTDFDSACIDAELSMKDIDDAEARLQRFAPFIMKCFPETRDRGGIIESVLTPVPEMKKLINEKYSSALAGSLLLKSNRRILVFSNMS